MQVTTISLTDMQWEWVKQKAIGGRGSMAEVIRQLIDEDMSAQGAGDLIQKKPTSKEKADPLRSLRRVLKKKEDTTDTKGDMTFEL